MDLKVELIGRLIEESALNLGAIHVDELDLEERAAIARHPLLRLRCHARLNFPVARESVERLDGHIHAWHAAMDGTVGCAGHHSASHAHTIAMHVN